MYKRGAYWDKWIPGDPPADKFDKLLDQDTLKFCLDSRLKCTGEYTPELRQATCLTGYYRWTTERREKIKACYTMKCLDQINCIAQNQVYELEPWLAGVPDPTPDAQ